MADFAGYAYAVVVFLGGLIGYVKAGSVASFASGTAFGAAAAYGAKLVSTNPKNVTLALAVSVALLLVMSFRFSKSGKFMPAGLVSLLSLVMTIRYGVRLIQ